MLIVSAWVPVYAALFFTILRPTDESGFARLAAMHVATFFCMLAALAIAVREVRVDRSLITVFMPVAAPVPATSARATSGVTAACPKGERDGRARSGVG